MWAHAISPLTKTQRTKQETGWEEESLVLSSFAGRTITNKKAIYITEFIIDSGHKRFALSLVKNIQVNQSASMSARSYWITGPS